MSDVTEAAPSDPPQVEGEPETPRSVDTTQGSNTGDVIEEPLDDRRDATDAAFADFDGSSPGCAVAVHDSDGSVHEAQYGTADLGIGVAIDETTVFDIGSVSKQMTAGAIALLVVEGELTLDDDFTDHVEELGPYDEVITVGDLMHHTSGLPDYIELLDAGDGDVTTMANALETISSDDGLPVIGPGVEFEYSNTNYVLLATIVERITSMSMAEFSADEIFEPLGMDATVLRDDQGVLLDDQAQGYVDDGEGWEPIGSSWRQTGDGAVHSTATDMLRWAELFLDEPGADGLGSAAWLDLMTTPGPVADGDDRYAGGLEVIGDGDDLTLRHGGSWIGYGSALTIRPSTGVAVAVACNLDGIDAEGLAETIYSAWAPDT